MAQIDSRLGDMIRSYREKLGLTQEEMAERLQVNLTHYGNIERAACNPSFSLFLRIAKELNLSVDAYLYSTIGSVPRPPDSCIMIAWIEGTYSEIPYCEAYL